MSFALTSSLCAPAQTRAGAASRAVARVNLIAAPRPAAVAPFIAASRPVSRSARQASVKVFAAANEEISYIMIKPDGVQVIYNKF